jgi:hydrogenase 3 maturation protease
MRTPQTKTILWGLGNPLRGDDGVGVRIAEALLEGPPEGMEIRLCETTPENHLAHLRRTKPSRLIIIDAALMGLAPGSIRRLSLSSIEGASWSSHGIPLPSLLEDFSREMEVVVIAIEPARQEYTLDLSPEVAKAKKLLLPLLQKDDLEHIPFLDRAPHNPIP